MTKTLMVFGFILVFSLFTVGLSSGLLQQVEAYPRTVDSETTCRTGQVLVYHINFRKFICTSESGAAQWIRHGIAEMVGEITPSGEKQLEKSDFAKTSEEKTRLAELERIFEKILAGERISKSEERMVKKVQQFMRSEIIAEQFYGKAMEEKPMEEMMVEDMKMYVEKPYVKFMGSNALYEPSVGIVNVFGPEGLFPFFDDVFSCGNSLECGVESKDAKIWGVMNVKGNNDANMVYIEYTSPITYGDTRDENPSQITDHKYRIELKDTNWNHPNNPIPTATPGFLLDGKGVALDQIMHGKSTIDTGHVVDGVANIPLFNNKATLYGHGIIKDITDPQNEFVVVDSIFLHVMVGNVIDEEKYFQNLQVVPLSPEIALVFAINIPSGVELPGGIGPLTPEQALGFTPPTGDPALTSNPPVDYSDLGIDEPIAHTTPWTVDNPEEPIHFTFLVFQNVESSNSATYEIHAPN